MNNNKLFPILFFFIGTLLSASVVSAENIGDTLHLDKLIKLVGERMVLARPIVEKSGNMQAMEVLKKAENHFLLAQEFNNQGKKMAALQQLQLAARLSSKALLLAQQDVKLDELLSRVSNKLTTYKPIIDTCSKEGAKIMYGKGQERYDEALKLKQKGRIQQAYMSARFAEQMLDRAKEMAGSGNPVDKLLQNLDDRIQKVKAIVDPSGNNEAKHALKEGIDHYIKAVEFNKDGKILEARSEIIHSRILVEKAWRLVQHP